MLKGKVERIFLVVAFAFCYFLAGAQNEAYNAFSPYTMYGIGDISRQGTSYNKSMGGVGIATRDKRAVSILNPASVTERETQSFMMDFSVIQGNRYYAQGDLRSSNNTFNMNGITISFPVWKSLAMYGCFSPYSDLGYDISSCTRYKVRAVSPTCSWGPDSKYSRDCRSEVRSSASSETSARTTSTP